MKRVLIAACAGFLLLTPVPSNAAAPSGFRFTVCNFSDPTVPRPTKKYPYAFLLSSRTASNGSAKVRRSVRSIQEVLRAADIRDDAGRTVVVDGVYGPQTAQAVARFQRKNGLIADGTVGPQTWKRLGKKFCFLFH